MCVGSMVKLGEMMPTAGELVAVKKILAKVDTQVKRASCLPLGPPFDF